jgi:hypothetical protein
VTAEGGDKQDILLTGPCCTTHTRHQTQDTDDLLLVFGQLGTGRARSVYSPYPGVGGISSRVGRAGSSICRGIGRGNLDRGLVGPFQYLLFIVVSKTIEKNVHKDSVFFRLTLVMGSMAGRERYSSASVLFGETGPIVDLGLSGGLLRIRLVLEFGLIVAGSRQQNQIVSTQTC